MARLAFEAAIEMIAAAPEPRQSLLKSA